MKDANLFEVHESGKLVTRKIPYKSPVLPQLMNGYTSDAELRVQDARMINSREFLFMPVILSPVLIYLIGKQWHHRYTTSFSVIYQLWIIGRTYSNPEDPYYLFNKEAVDKARSTMMDEMTLFDENLFKSVQNFPLNVSEGEFLKFMQIATIDRIRILEKCIQATFSMPFPPLLTPYEFPSIDQLSKEDQLGYWKYLENYFECKGAVRSDRLKKESGIEENREYFPAIKEKNYSKLLREYFLYLRDE